MRSIWIAVLASGAALGADADFNGRWNIHVNPGRGRVWWLEVSGAGTPALAGKFVGAPGGQVDRIPEIRIEQGELIFVFRRETPAPSGSAPQKMVQTFRARVVKGELQGTRNVETDGKNQPVVPWRGVRAPVILDRDDGTWKAGVPVALFNGRDTTGWRQVVPNLPGWYARDGNLMNNSGASDIASEARFWNFVLRAEYRYGAGSNSGIGLRGRYEIQIHDNYGRQPDLHGSGALYSRIAPSVNASLAPGEWQVLEIRLVGRTLTVKLNGVTVIDRGEVEGPTAMTIDPNEDQPGPIALQGDHGIIEFRKLEVTPLTR